MVSEIQPGQYFSHPDTMGENNIRTALKFFKGSGIKMKIKLEKKRKIIASNKKSMIKLLKL